MADFNADIGRTQFLQLLVSQLQYQNPLEPMAQEEFLGQLAQFSMLDGVEQLNVNFESLIKLQSLSQGADLVGKRVEYISPITNDKATGVVDAARVVNGDLQVTIEDVNVPVAQVIAVLADAA